MSPPDQATVLSAFDDGIESIERLALLTEDWTCPTPCEGWTGADLAGHLVCIVRYYHRLLDAARAGRPLHNLPRGERLRAMNAADLDGLPEAPGEQRASEFVSQARRYRSRIGRERWDLVLGEWDEVGARTIHEHTGLAVAEWHIHAWDLATAVGVSHRPQDPPTVAACYRPGSDPGGDPWRSVLLAAGRMPW